MTLDPMPETVDCLRRTIRVEKQRLQLNQIAPLKSKGSRLTVPVGQVVIDALAAQLAFHRQLTLVQALRGFCADLGRRLGEQVQTFLGHASAVVTLRTYAHLWPGDEDRTRNVLDAALDPLGALADSLRTDAASEG
jgi:integrase